jgi:hypothetical protein
MLSTILSLLNFSPRQMGKFFVGLVIVILVGYVGVMIFIDAKPVQKQALPTEALQLALIEQAKVLFVEKVNQGVDMNSGPCLSDSFDIGWVVDVAHNPRQPIDDIMENQCQSYIIGEASHIIELDIRGNLIRLQ